MSSYSHLFRRLPRPTPLLIAATAAALLIALPTIRLTLLHNRLSKRITSHSTHIGPAAHTHLANLQNQPNSLTQPTPPLPAAHLPAPILLPSTPTTHALFHDLSTLSLPTSSLPAHLPIHDLLTAYLQHTMALFSTTPQAYALWAVSQREARRSFEREWIESLPFEEGGLVCGVYRVLGRGEDRGGDGGGEGERERGWVCFGMVMGGVEGRLIVGLVREGAADGKRGRGNGEGRSVFSTETWMWVEKERGVVMPMERRVPRMMHRLGSWWLLVRGTEWLQGLAA